MRTDDQEVHKVHFKADSMTHNRISVCCLLLERKKVEKKGDNIRKMTASFGLNSDEIV